MTEATERGELRELLFDGVAPPPDTDAMFERTFAATGDDGAHLLPPDDLFDGTGEADDLPLDDGTLLDDGALLDGSDEPDPGDGGAVPDDPAAEWSGPADLDAAADGADPGTPDVPFDHPTSGW